MTFPQVIFQITSFYINGKGYFEIFCLEGAYFQTKKDTLLYEKKNGLVS